MKAVHEELKEIRLKKNISLKNISEKTKIRIDFLEKLEEGDFTIAPMPYIRAFIREYAEFVGVDQNLILLRLDNKVNSVSPEENKPEILEKPDTVPVSIREATSSDEPPREKQSPESLEKSEPQTSGTVIEEKQSPSVDIVPLTSSAVEKTVTNAVHEMPKHAEQPEKTAPTELAEPKSYSTLIFAMFIIIITVVALIIFFINKG